MNYSVDLNQISFDNFLGDETLVKNLSEYVQNRLPKIKRGDLVNLLDETYIWDGKRIMELDYTFDQYGHLPKQFQVSHSEFSPLWWKDTIRHNSIFWLADDIKYQMCFAIRDNIIYSDVRIGYDIWKCFVVTRKNQKRIDFINTDNVLFHWQGYWDVFPPYYGKCFYMEIL